MKKSPYDVIKSRYVTEKAAVMEQLQFNTNNKCVKRCQKPKYMFLVDPKSNKQEIADAFEEIYREKKIKVTAVNTVNTKQKKRRVRGRPGFKAGFKKAVITLAPGQSIE